LYNASLATGNNSTVTNDGNTLKLTLTRKSASELGLSGNAATVLDPLSQAALADDSFGTSLLQLKSNGEVQKALGSVIPDLAGGVRALAVAMTDQSTGVIAARQRQLLTAPLETRNEFHFWTQEFYNNVQDGGRGSSNGFSGAGQGLALGGEWGTLQTGR